jgi:rod shape-determining protein MreC
VAVSRRPARRPRYVLLLLVLASATIITLGYRGGAQSAINGLKSAGRDVFSPVQSGVQSALRPIGNFFEGAFHYGALQSENARLLQENAKLRAQGLAAANAVHEAQALQRLAGVPWVGGTPQVQADVVATSPSNFSDTVELDKGTTAGVATGMPVVSGNGLVGRVVSVSRDRSTVLLITDPTSNAGVRFARDPSTVAVAGGQGQGRPIAVDFVNPHTRVSKGEGLVTAGTQGALYPPDIPVGRITSATLSPSGRQWTLSLKPLVDLNGLQYVSVLEWSPRS